MDLDAVDRNHKLTTVFQFYGNDFTFLHDKIPRLLKGLPQIRRDDVGNIFQNVLIEDLAVAGRHAESLRLTVPQLARVQRDHLPTV